MTSPGKNYSADPTVFLSRADVVKQFDNQIRSIIPHKSACETCRFWSPTPDYSTVTEIKVGYCKHPMVCQPNHGVEDNKVMTVTGILTSDEGGDTGQLVTAHHFSCCHFDRKP